MDISVEEDEAMNNGSVVVMRSCQWIIVKRMRAFWHSAVSNND